MKYKDDVVFWSDISLVALEAVMYQKGEVNSAQYLNVKNATEDIIKFMQKTGLTKDFLESSVSVFNEVLRIFLSTELAKSTSPKYVPATLVAICVRNNIEDEINLDIFNELIGDAYAYLSNYQYKCVHNEK